MVMGENLESEIVNSIRLTRESTDSWMTVISPVGLSQDFWDEWVAEKLPGWEVIGWGDDYDGEHRRLGYPDGIGPDEIEGGSVI
jgi:hypothetical protein